MEFSELGEFIDVPIKNYSSGMKARLGFSIATVVEPEILILDEVLAVGDAAFRKKSEAKLQGMFDKGVTVLFVSHSVKQVRRICNKAIILDHGEVKRFGDIDAVADEYVSIIRGGKPTKRMKMRERIRQNVEKELRETIEKETEERLRVTIRKELEQEIRKEIMAEYVNENK